ncbi:hypothetical protein I314_04985 [Cryptococcus bacillisporus CA1873]|uniref:Uncharacterized protein n=1 Tax=Cryptococcus bacillisporus CA1873 TaxID=1296111 RepID=A0ABR5B5X4_CRYGA|nr:hypothetical protein I314_04985 [Cryptococcus bacillisporus CA1873]|eukprot:KIR59001.1 hypothetical protein I314_04985 [Cryptococcus gattii CA1873]
MAFRECVEPFDGISGLQWAHYDQKRQSALRSLKGYNALGRFVAERSLKPITSKTQLSSPSSSPTIVMTASVHSGKGHLAHGSPADPP